MFQSLLRDPAPSSRAQAPSRAVGRGLEVGRPLKLALVVALAVALAIDPWFVTGVLQNQRGGDDFADFNMFYLAGQLLLSGRFADAYQPVTMASLETALAHGHAVAMPWFYPPVFGFLVGPLAMLPLGISDLVFTTATLFLFWFSLRRLGGADFWPVVLAAAPAMFINIRAGQNGLLTGGLFGLAAFLLLRGRPVAAGSAMGCFVFKPHLAPVLPLMLVLQKRWTTLAVAALCGLALTGLSILVFGPAAFSAFLQAGRQAGRYMAGGVYPLHRMTSLYAFTLSLGAPVPVAAALHGVVAAGVLGWTAWVVHVRRNLRLQIGMAATACAFVSPYFMDYDGTIFAVGLLLLAPTLSRSMAPRHYGILLASVAAAQLQGIAAEALGSSVSLGGPVLFAAYLVMMHRVHAGGVTSGEVPSQGDPAIPAYLGSAP